MTYSVSQDNDTNRQPCTGTVLALSSTSLIIPIILQKGIKPIYPGSCEGVAYLLLSQSKQVKKLELEMTCLIIKPCFYFLLILYIYALIGNPVMFHRFIKYKGLQVICKVHEK